MGFWMGARRGAAQHQRGSKSGRSCQSPGLLQPELLQPGADQDMGLRGSKSGRGGYPGQDLSREGGPDPGWVPERRVLDRLEKGRGSKLPVPEASSGSLPERDTLLLPPTFKQAVLLCVCVRERESARKREDRRMHIGINPMSKCCPVKFLSICRTERGEIGSCVLERPHHLKPGNLQT